MKAVALAGRRIDDAGTGSPSFPLDRVEPVREALRRRFASLSADALICSAACGADLVALEVAGEMGLRRHVILPFAKERFRETSVVDRPGDWGPVFDRVLAAVDRVSDLQGSPGGDAIYLEANERILDEALRVAGGRPEEIVAVIVWEGRRKSPTDATAGFADRARERGMRVEEVHSLATRGRAP